MWHSGEGMGWWMLLGSVWFVVFWGLVIWAFVTVTSRITRGQEGRSETALDIAKRRYASGEIGREEYEGLRRDLGT